MRAIDRGQLLVLLFAFGVIIVLWKLTPAAAEELIKELIRRFADYSLAGWLFFVLSLLGWAIHAKWQRRKGSDEVSRVAKERTEAQAKVVGPENTKSSQKIKGKK